MKRPHVNLIEVPRDTVKLPKEWTMFVYGIGISMQRTLRPLRKELYTDHQLLVRYDHASDRAIAYG